MSKQRKLIRQATADCLKNRTGAGIHVFPSRSEVLWENSELPAICIYTGRETISIEQESPRQYKRELELKIEIGATGFDADDQLDDIGHEVEQLVGRSDRLYFMKEHTVSDIILTNEAIEFRDDGDATIGSLVLVYLATYYTFEPDEEDVDPVDNFERVGTNYDLNAQQAPADQSSDIVELQE